MNPDPVDLICRKIRESRRVAITAHLRPDGDSVCTSLALAIMGERLGKTMSIINKDNTPIPFCLFPGADRIRIGQIDPAEFDMVILLECADVSRSGQENLGDCFKINIDHHYSNFTYADINWVNPRASAVGEMVFELGERLEVPIPPQAADYLYCAIVSDTGSFQFSNTTAKAFETCHKLTSLGASPIKVSEMLYNNNPPEKIKLLGQVLSTLRMNLRGNLAVITMFRKNLSDLNLKEIDTEDITTQARTIKGVEMVLFFKEMEKDTFRVSLRSKGRANAALVAEHFGGGGHIHASGFTAYGSYEKLIVEIPETVERLLTSARPGSLAT
jgi:phosphoesterase RecJ-like protein